MLVLLFLLGEASAIARPELCDSTHREDEQADERHEQDAEEIEAPSADEEAKYKSGYGEEPTIGGPTSVSAELAEGDLRKMPVFRYPAFDRALSRWFNTKKTIHERLGLKIGFDYAALYQRASSSLDTPTEEGEQQGAVGIARVLMAWTLFGDTAAKTTGTLKGVAETRHGLGTEISPAELGFAIGYQGITGTLFSKPGVILTTLYWEQDLWGRGGFVVGRIDPFDFSDILGYANPWRGFQNLGLFINTSMAIPDPGLGAGAGAWIGDNLYALGVLSDANGLLDELDFFPGGAEFFTYGELGWVSSPEQRYTRNVHAGAWHQNEREDAGVPRSWGANASFNWLIGGIWLPFGRAGWSDGEAPLMNTIVTGGLGRLFTNRSDVGGLSVGWASPANSGLRDQISSEAFYRLQFAQNLSMTPSIQALFRPALNPDKNLLWIFSMRMRLTL